MLERLRDWTRRARRDVVALHLAARDPRVPWLAKAVVTCVAAYALSPIDLIPDLVPVPGYLDDLVVVPLGVLLAIRLVPPDLTRAGTRVPPPACRPAWAGAGRGDRQVGALVREVGKSG